MKHPATAAVLLILLTGAGHDSSADPERELGILLKPVANGSRITDIEITETLPAGQHGSPEPLIEMAFVTFNVPAAVAEFVGPDARDEEGALALNVRDEGEGAQRKRRWYAERPVRGAVTLRYRVPIAAQLAPRGAAPPTELRAEGGAISGGGSSFLLRPPSGTYRFRVSWDLSGLPAGASADSSLGQTPSEPLSVQALDTAYFMAGSLGRYPVRPTDGGFLSVWQGNPPFEPMSLMTWADQLRSHYVRFFDAPAATYRIFMRRNQVNPGGGIGMLRSFVITYGDSDNDIDDLKFTLAHEMFHTFQPLLVANEGLDSSLAESWFNEGLAVFYQRALPFRYGMIDAATFLRDVNLYAARYYTNALGNLPNSEVAAGFWRDTRIRTLPYDRGFLYFVTVDEAVRKTSSGRRSLDDLLLKMIERQRTGKRLAANDWEQVVTGELGPVGAEGLHAMLAGATPLPQSEAFGPCFRRVKKSLRRYELGFEPAVLTEPQRIVRGLVIGSAAEKAGLRDGDEITMPVGQDRIQGDQTGVLTLHVRRGREELSIGYVPRGETVEAWQWERIGSVPDRACVVASRR